MYRPSTSPARSSCVPKTRSSTPPWRTPSRHATRLAVRCAAAASWCGQAGHELLYVLQ
jgi:hypothetical protein